MAPLDADDGGAGVVDAGDIVVVAVAEPSTAGNPSTDRIAVVVVVAVGVAERDGRLVRAGSAGSYPRRCGSGNRSGW